MLLSGVVADLLQKKEVFSTTSVRKLAFGIGKWSCGDLLTEGDLFRRYL